jgi:hypothetical protein
MRQCFLFDLGSQLGQLIHEGMSGGRQVKSPDAAVTGIGAPLDEAGVAQPVNHPAKRDALDLQQLRKLALRQALMAAKKEQSAPLRSSDAQLARPCVEPIAYLACDVVHEERDVVLSIHKHAYIIRAYQ